VGHDLGEVKLAVKVAGMGTLLGNVAPLLGGESFEDGLLRKGRYHRGGLLVEDVMGGPGACPGARWRRQERVLIASGW
jgi:hypothetical protein